MEKALCSRMTDLLCLDSTLVFHDTTLVSVHSEPVTNDEERQSVRCWSRIGSAQFLLALDLSRDGLPFAHEVKPGNTADVTTVKEAVSRLKQRFEIRQCVFVGLAAVAGCALHSRGPDAGAARRSRTGCCPLPAATRRSPRTCVSRKFRPTECATSPATTPKRRSMT